ncbi:hypothetical protein F5148DRAFT_1013693 [Russula earlei]|uniref:Uncharacterized protein n=1 Tax=Russula earlei TaxID=71964 RepID=A0ACC0UBC2_9AGAM|nr:hypothetical protein F5148DRAFT_1013693 [Russula earlei]
MSPYIVPDHALGRSFPTTLTPTFWASLTIIPFDTLGPSPTQVVSEDDVPAPSSAPSEASLNAKTPQSNLADLPPVHHNQYFFDDGNIAFLVEGILYRLHRYLFCGHSNELKDRISWPSETEESSSPPIMPLADVKSADFDALLSILYPRNYDTLEQRSFEEWSSILALSTRWGFTSIRDLALRCVKPPSPLHRLILARKYNVEKWVLPALLELCERPQPLSVDEGRLIDFEDVVLVMSVRQTVRSSNLTVAGAEIKDCIQASTRGEPWSPVPEARPASRAPSPTPDYAQQSVPSENDWPASKIKKKRKGKCSCCVHV